MFKFVYKFFAPAKTTHSKCTHITAYGNIGRGRIHALGRPDSGAQPPNRRSLMAFRGSGESPTTAPQAFSNALERPVLSPFRPNPPLFSPKNNSIALPS